MLANVRSYIQLKTWMSRSSGVIVSVVCLGSLIYVTQKLYNFTTLEPLIQFQLFHNFALLSMCLVCGVTAVSMRCDRFIGRECRILPRGAGRFRTSSPRELGTMRGADRFA